MVSIMVSENYSCEYYLNRIEEDIHLLVETQKEVNTIYDGITCNNYDESYDVLFNKLKEEQELLHSLEYHLNKLFNINPTFFKWLRTFHIRENCLMHDRYEISPPLRLDKTNVEYILLKKLLIRLHEHYFLLDGGIGYSYSRVESHMWEIPNMVYENDLINRIRIDITKRK